MVKKGKILTLVSISVAIAVMLFMMLIDYVFSSASYGFFLFYLFMGISSISLYHGSKWAKWIIAIFLIIFAGIQVKHFLPPFDNIGNPAWFTILFLLTISSFLFSILLVFSKSVSNFVNDQFLNRTDTIKKFLKYSWTIFFILLLVQSVSDVYRMFFKL